MKIKESIAYNKHTGEMIGFVNLGDINNTTCDLQRELNNTSDHPSITSHLLTLMVQGVFFNLDFPLVHFGTDNVTASELFPIVWKGVRHLENSGFKVIGITADGGGPNRFFFLKCIRKLNESCTYKTKIPYANNEEHDIYFFSDLPHLIKTVRNCLSNSYGHGYTRKLWVIYRYKLTCIPYTIRATPLSVHNLADYIYYNINCIHHTNYSYIILFIQHMHLLLH